MMYKYWMIYDKNCLDRPFRYTDNKECVKMFMKLRDEDKYIVQKKVLDTPFGYDGEELYLSKMNILSRKLDKSNGVYRPCKVEVALTMKELTSINDGIDEILSDSYISLNNLHCRLFKNNIVKALLTLSISEILGTVYHNIELETVYYDELSILEDIIQYQEG